MIMQPNQPPQDGDQIDEAALRERAQRKIDQDEAANGVEVDDNADDSPNVSHP